jgi:acyl-CoA thioesterase FadM
MNIRELIETGKVIERLREKFVDKLARAYSARYVAFFDDAAIELLKELNDEVAD